MYLEELKSKTIKAKHHRINYTLTGNKYSVVYYMYSKIMEGIDDNRFIISSKGSAAKTIFFTVKIEHGVVLIRTHYSRNITHYKSFKCVDKKEAEDMFEVIKNAANLIGLNCVPIRFSQNTIEIFKEKEKSNF